MKMTSPVVAVTAILVGAIIGATWLFLNVTNNSDPPSVADLIGAPKSAERVQLFRPGNEFLRSEDYTSMSTPSDRRPIESIKPDGGIFDIYLRRDLTKEFTLDFYPAVPGVGKMLKAATSYAGDGKTKVGEIAFGSNGLRHLRGKILPNGSYETTEFFANGIDEAVVSEVGIGPNIYDTTPALLSQTRWHENHTLAYTSVLNKDNSRTNITFDSHGAQIGVANLSPSISGSTVVLYYDGGKQVRLRSTSDYYTTAVEMFTEKGVLERTAKITDGMLELTYWDPSGKKMALQQTWFFKRVERNGIAYMDGLHIYSVTEPDANGGEARSWYWRGSQVTDKHPATLWSFQEFNTSLASHPQVMCKRIIHIFREDETLMRDDCQGSSTGADFSVEHTVAEKLMPPPAPAADLILPQLDADLPLPRSQGVGGH